MRPILACGTDNAESTEESRPPETRDANIGNC